MGKKNGGAQIPRGAINKGLKQVFCVALGSLLNSASFDVLGIFAQPSAFYRGLQN